VRLVRNGLAERREEGASGARRHGVLTRDGGRSFRRRLATQLLALLIPWSLFVAVCLALVFHRQVDGFQRDRNEQAGRSLAHEAAELFHDGDTAGLVHLVDEHRGDWRELRYLFMQEPSGDLIWSSFEGGTPASLLGLHGGEETAGPVRLELTGELLDDFLLRDSGLLVRVGFDVTPARVVTQKMVPVLLLTSLIGLLVVSALAAWLSRPVEALDAAVRRAVELDRATAGELDLDDTVSETAAIASSFGDVMDRLEQRTRQLDSARKLAYLGEISTSIAHDVNNPLGVVLLNAGFLKRRLEAGQLPQLCADEIHRTWRAARRATLVVQKFLQFSRYEGDKRSVAHRRVDLAGLVDEALELLEDRLRKTTVTVRAEVAEGLDPVPCDEQGLMQVLLNLVINAIDASPPEGEVVISVRVSDDQLELQVQDAGSGMDPEVLHRIHEPFFTTKEDGTGLGVSISRSIVRSHDGQLRFDSAAGLGTTATVELPLRGRNP